MYTFNFVRKEENVLFNDTLNTFHLQLRGIGHMVKDHSDKERGNLLLSLHQLHKEYLYTFIFVRKEENVLFNDALNKFHSQLYGVGHMVKDLTDKERGSLLPPLHQLLFLISRMGSFICIIP